MLGKSDWDDSKTHLNDLKGTTGTVPATAKAAADKLWEDNWDDDDIEDDFSVQLRCVVTLQLAFSELTSVFRSELAKKPNQEPMQH